MSRLAAVLAALLLAPTSLTADPSPPVPLRPVHTYSIVARDPATGEMGVAVQSHCVLGRLGRDRGPRRASARSRRSRSSTRATGRSASR